MMVRGNGLAASMSRYLIDRIAATPNIELMTETEIVALEGDPATGLERVRWRDRRSGDETTSAISPISSSSSAPIRRPAGSTAAASTSTGRASSSTGARASDAVPGRAEPSLETSVPGVFAVGDVRSGSVKRVGGAIGEGAQVVPRSTAILADLSRRNSLTRTETPPMAEPCTHLE